MDCTENQRTHILTDICSILQQLRLLISWRRITELGRLAGNRYGHNSTKNDELLEKYKKRVYVDFSLDLEEFQSQGASTDSSTFKVIYARFTTGFYAQGDANQVIYRYLKGKKKDSKG